MVFESLVVTEMMKGRTAKGRQTLKYLDSLSASWKDNVSPTQLISRQRTVLWHRMVADVNNRDLARGGGGGCPLSASDKKNQQRSLSTQRNS